ncbi:MAG TPA: type IV secretory system conjugative DNA transfer family protein [Candidatus Acidoferrales bacterium]|nr:type IV secretory system conjugative DNA transfer family protein [Candidatus Acidoferrales bacterium]
MHKIPQYSRTAGRKSTEAFGTAPRIVAAILLCMMAAPDLLAQKPLQLNTYYMCNGQRIVAVSCVDASDKPYNDCVVQFPDRAPLANGQTPGTFVLHSALVKLIQTCTVVGTPSKIPTGGGTTTTTGGGRTTASSGWLGSILGFFGNIFSFVAGIMSGLFGAFGTLVTWVFWIAVFGIAIKLLKRFADGGGGESGNRGADNVKGWKKSNRAALELFGPTPELRTARIDEVFDKRQETVRATLVDSGFDMRVEMGRSLAAMTLREVEALRTCYHLYNLDMQQYNNFYIGRIGIIYGDGKGMLYGESKYGINDFDQYIGGYKLEQSVNIALQDLMKALQTNPDHPVLAKLKSRLLGGGGDLVPSAPLKSTDNVASISTGLILGLDDKTPKKVWYYDGEGSLITVAPTRSGKTEGQVYPNMLRFKGPAIVLDVKGEIYAKTSKWRKENVGPVYKFSPLDRGNTHCYNPLTAVRSDSIWSDSGLIADLMIVPDEKASGNSKFFQAKAAEVLQAAIAYVCLEKDVTKRPMSKVIDIIYGVGWDEFVTYLQARVDMPTLARAGASLATTLPPETRGNVLQEAQAAMKSWMGDEIEAATTKSDWTPLDLRKGTGHGDDPTIYLCFDLGQIKSYRSVLRVLVGQHINMLCSGPPPPRTNPPRPPILFLLDELPQLSNMPPVEQALVVGAGYGIKLWMFTQDIGQLKQAYENAEGMVGNCGVRMYMNPDLNNGTAQKLSEDIGYRESVIDGSRVKVVEPNVLAGEEYKDMVIVWARGMARPGRVRKNFAYMDPTLTSRMGSV